MWESHGKKRHPTFQPDQVDLLLHGVLDLNEVRSETVGNLVVKLVFLRGNVGKSWVGQIGGFLKVHYNPNPCLDGWISWDFWSFFTRKFFRNPFSSELDPPTSFLPHHRYMGWFFQFTLINWCNMQLFVTKIDKVLWYLTTKFGEALLLQQYRSLRFINRWCSLKKRLQHFWPSNGDLTQIYIIVIIHCTLPRCLRSLRTGTYFPLLPECFPRLFVGGNMSTGGSLLIDVGIPSIPCLWELRQILTFSS